MIRLRRHGLPPAVRKAAIKRSKRYLSMLREGTTVPKSLSNAYRDSQLKNVLKAETSEKCAYCESKVLHVDHGDVEHILAKSCRPELRIKYTNLTLVCRLCNQAKSNYYDPGCRLINPFTDEPSDHLVAVGPMVMRKAESDRGLVTEKTLTLNRPALIERRKEKIEGLQLILDQVARTQNDAVRKVLLSQLELECTDEVEYALVARSYVATILATLP